MPFARAIDSLFARLGRAAVYYPALGAAKAVTVVFKKPDKIVGLGQIGVEAPYRIADVRASEIAAPLRGDWLVVAAETLSVRAARVDELGLVWTLDLALKT